MRLITSACGTFGALWIWRDAGFESAISSEPALHQPLQLKLIFFVPVDGWSLVAAARCRVTGEDGRSSLDRTDHGPLLQRDSDPDQVIDEPLVAFRQPFGPLEQHPLGF